MPIKRGTGVRWCLSGQGGDHAETAGLAMPLGDARGEAGRPYVMRKDRLATCRGACGMAKKRHSG